MIGTCYHDILSCIKDATVCFRNKDHCEDCIKGLADADNSNSIWRKCQPNGYHLSYNGMVSNDLCKLNYKITDI